MSPKASPTGDITAREFRRLRRKRGMSQPELAQAIGVATETVSRYERGVMRIPRVVELALGYVLSKKGTKQ